MIFNREFYSRFFILVLFLFISVCSYSQNSFPGKTWEVVENPAEFGYSLDKLEAAKQYSNGINTAAVVIIVNG